MKRIATTAFLFCATLVLAGCGGSTATEESTTGTTTTTTEKTTGKAPAALKTNVDAGKVGSALFRSLKKGGTEAVEEKTETP